MRETNGLLQVVPVDTTGAPLATIDGIAAGAAGSPNPDVVSVQGVPGGSPLAARPSEDYETVAASQTAQVLGGAGAAGDWLAGVLVIPGTTSPGAVAILDGATSITVFAGGASSVADLKPFFVPIGAASVNGAWKVTTGANVSAIGVGDFTP